MTDRTIRFPVSAELSAEADLVASELGISVEEIASRAFQGYLAGTREARRLAHLPSASDESAPLEGDEHWLSTLD